MRSRYTCPSCGKAKKFTRYIDTSTNEYLADHVGKCERENNCGYHFRPKEFFQENPLNRPATIEACHPKAKPMVHEPSYIPRDIVEKSLVRGVNANNFLQFLKNRFGEETVSISVERFNIGTSKHWPGATVFWQIDSRGMARTGKIMLYNSETGKRVKDDYARITWVHSVLTQTGSIPKPFTLHQCLFGEHQVKAGRIHEIIVLESEKTAIISSIYLPDFTWMACGGLSMLNSRMLQAIIKFPIILYPDLKALDKWEAKAEELRRDGFRVTVSAFLEKISDRQDREAGLDLADYLLKLDPPKSITQRLIEKHPAVQNLIETLDLVPLF